MMDSTKEIAMGKMAEMDSGGGGGLVGSQSTKTRAAGAFLRGLSVLGAGLLVLGLSGCGKDASAPAAAPAAGLDAAPDAFAQKPGEANVAIVKGMAGSEKLPFLTDPRVVEALAKRGLRVAAEKVGSRDIVTRSYAGYDFAFPSGAPAAMEIAAKAGAKSTYSVFYTPLAIATWKALVPTLEREGVATKAAAGYHVADMGRLMAIMQKGARWRDLKGSEAYPSSKSVLLTSTDVRTSNSAAMYLALASYVANGNEVVGDPASAAKAAAAVAGLFTRQGLQEASSAGPFEDYATMGMGKAPMVVVYESQFVEHQIRRGSANPDMALMYPSPTIFSKSVLVPFTENGRRLGEALSEDPAIAAVAAEYGYRSSDMARFRSAAKTHGVFPAETLVDVIDPPSLTLLDAMASAIAEKMK